MAMIDWILAKFSSPPSLRHRGIREGHDTLSDEKRPKMSAELVSEVRKNLADVIISADLIAMELDIDLAAAVPGGLNETSSNAGMLSLVDPQNPTGGWSFIVRPCDRGVHGWIGLAKRGEWTGDGEWASEPGEKSVVSSERLKSRRERRSWPTAA